MQARRKPQNLRRGGVGRQPLTLGQGVIIDGSTLLSRGPARRRYQES